MIDKERIFKLNKLIEDKGNGFVLCRSVSDFDAIRSVVKDLIPDNISFPFYIRIGQGKVKDIINEEDAEGLDLTVRYKYFTYGELCDKHSWRYCGGFNACYGLTAKQYRDDMFQFDKDCTFFDSCHNCGKTFDDDEILYEGFFSEKGGGFKRRCLCKKCAYAISNRVTDYEGTSEENVKVTEWRKEGENWIEQNEP